MTENPSHNEKANGYLMPKQGKRDPKFTHYFSMIPYVPDFGKGGHEKIFVFFGIYEF